MGKVVCTVATGLSSQLIVGSVCYLFLLVFCHVHRRIDLAFADVAAAVVLCGVGTAGVVAGYVVGAVSYN